MADFCCKNVIKFPLAVHATLVATAAEDRLNIRRNAQVVCGSQRLPNNPDL
jgi:hypothetical protein